MQSVQSIAAKNFPESELYPLFFTLAFFAMHEFHCRMKWRGSCLFLECIPKGRESEPCNQKEITTKKEWVVDVSMCVSVCLLQVNGVEEFCGFALLELCSDRVGAKLLLWCP
jgi:hypothetical protein